MGAGVPRPYCVCKLTGSKSWIAQRVNDSQRNETGVRNCNVDESVRLRGNMKQLSGRRDTGARALWLFLNAGTLLT